MKKQVYYIQSIFLMDVWFFAQILIDDYQQPLTIFYWYLALDFLIYFGLFNADSETGLKIFALSLLLNFLVQFGWGIYVWKADDKYGAPYDPWDKNATGEPNQYFLSYWYTIFYFWN